MGAVYVVDYRYFDMLHAAFGRDRILLPSVPCLALDGPVTGHPDMALFTAASGQVICAPQVFSEYEKLLAPFGVRVICGKRRLMGNYPDDVAYNVLLADRFAFSAQSTTDEQVCRSLEEAGYKWIPVAQGYARCSALSLAGAVVTADPSIFQTSQEVGLCVLRIRPGHILLPGYDYGFIGGACGLTEKREVLVCGDLDTHPDGAAIRRFIKTRGFFLQEIPGQSLLDVGTIFRIDL